MSNSSSSWRTWKQTCRSHIEGERFRKVEAGVKEALGRGVRTAARRGAGAYAPGAKRKSDFFRDIAGSRYHVHAEEVARAADRPTNSCSTSMTSRSST